MRAASHFDKSRLPGARSYYEAQGFKLQRPNGKGWAMAIGSPPCHRSKSGKSLSVNSTTGAFHCFGCGAKGGDIVAFVMLRDHLSFKAAAQSLGAWRDVSGAERVQLDAAAAERVHEREQALAAKELERRQRIEIRDEVHTAARIQKKASDRLSELCQGAIPTSVDEEEACWAVLALALVNLRDCEARYCASSMLEYLG